MQKYILEGDPKEVAKVIQENRIRIERGVITFTPVQPETVLDPDCIKTLKENLATKDKEYQQLSLAQLEHAELADKLVAIIVTSGQTIPDELVTKLDSFGIDIPEIAETVPEVVETVPEVVENADNPDESVPETVPNNPEPVEDNKNIDVEDMIEVNLDDVKDISETDTKDAPTPTSKKTRSKKSQ